MLCLIKSFWIFLFYELVLKMLENSKNIRNFYGDEKLFAIKDFFLNFFYFPRYPYFPLMLHSRKPML